MSADLERLAREFKRRGFKDLGDSLRAQSKVAKALGAPEHFVLPKGEDSGKKIKSEVSATTELDLESEWQRQTNKYLELGYHTQLDLTDEAYLSSLPKFEPQPEEYQGRFDIPLLVEVRISWEKQAQLAGIVVTDYLRSRINQTRPYNKNSETPNVPYTGWFNSWGQRFAQKIAPIDARIQLASDECGAGPNEGIAIEAMYPDITKSGKYFDLIGYQVGSGSVPYLGRWGGRPGLDASLVGSAGDYFRPLVRGSKIITR